MKNTDEAIRLFPPATYLISVVDIATKEIEVFDDFEGFDSEGNPVYSGVEVKFNPEYQVELRTNRFLSEFQLQFKAQIKLAKQGIKTRFANLIFTIN